MSEDGSSPDPGQELRAALVSLPTEEVLALAYRFRTEPERLYFYLDVLRQLGGWKAALAAALICFDLASQGQPTAQREFEALAATLQDFHGRAEIAEGLIAGSPYLEELWPRCQQALQGLDPRTSAADALASDDIEALEIDLFDAEELVDFEDMLVESIDPAQLVGRYLLAVEAFFDNRPDRTGPAKVHGFFARSRHDVERVESFLLELDSLREYVPEARGLLALGEIFLASHLRTRTFWGKPNPRRAELIASGLQHFLEAGEGLFTAAAYFGDRDADEHAWPKVLQVLLDFFAWRAGENPGPLDEAVTPYARLARQLPLLRFDDRRSGNR